MIEVEIRDREVLEAFFRRDVALHIYELGDLDPFFWPSTRWFAWSTAAGAIPDAVFLLYSSPGVSTLLGLERMHPEAAATLTRAIEGRLPDRLYAHLSPGLVDVFRSAGWSVETETASKKLTLDPEAFRRSTRARASASESESIVRLDRSHTEEVQRFYAEAYPQNWFDPRMLDTGQYFAVRTSTGWAAVAGVHVYSPAYGVAALGNIATHPAHRRRGWASLATRHLCQSLLDEGIPTIGLNVHAANVSAIACYAGLGFSEASAYGEYALTRE